MDPWVEADYNQLSSVQHFSPLAPTRHNWLAVMGWLVLLGAMAVPGYLLFVEKQYLLMLALVAMPLLVLCFMKPAIGLYVFAFAAAFDSVTQFGEEGTVLGFITIIKPIAAIVFLSCLPYAFRGHKPLQVSRGLIGTFALLAIWTTISIIWSFQRIVSIQYSLLMIGQIALLLIMVKYVMQNVDVFRNFVLWLVVGGVACSIFLFFAGVGMTGGLGRASIGGANSNAVAIGLVVAISVLPLLWTTTYDRLHRILIIVAGLVIYAGIFFTGSKAGVLCVILGVLVGGVFEARYRGFVRLFRLLGVLLIISIITLILLESNLLPGGSQLRLKGMFRLGETQESIERGRLRREGVWRLAWITYRRSGQIPIGVGAGAIEYANLIIGTASKRHSAHNNFLQALVEMGPIGLLLMLAVHIHPAVLLMRLRNRRLIAPGMVALSAPLLTGLTHGTWTSKFFWIPILITVLLCEVDAQMSQERETSPYIEPESARYLTMPYPG